MNVHNWNPGPALSVPFRRCIYATHQTGRRHDCRPKRLGSDPDRHSLHATVSGFVPDRVVGYGTVAVKFASQIQAELSRPTPDHPAHPAHVLLTGYEPVALFITALFFLSTF